MRQTKRQRRRKKKEEREGERERGVSLSRETVPSVDTGEGNYNAAKTHI